MEDKKVIKNEKQKGHKLSKELEARMANEALGVMELEEAKRKKAEFDKKFKEEMQKQKY